MYVDGSKQTEILWPANKRPVTLPIKYIGGKNFRGELDDVIAFNKVLSDSEIAALSRRPGLNTPERMSVVRTEKQWLPVALSGHQSEIVYNVQNEDVLTIDSDGFIVPKKVGETVVTVSTQDGAYSKNVAVSITHPLHSQIPTYILPESFARDMDRPHAEYLGQPDMVKLADDQTLITVYPKGHGHGEIVLRRSEDGGQTWSERLEVPEEWIHSRETPTLYTLNFADGHQEVMRITGGPKQAGWGDGKGGFYTSISKDKGLTWSSEKNSTQTRPSLWAWRH